MFPSFCLQSNLLINILSLHKLTSFVYSAFHFQIVSLRGFLSIDIDVSELYINQCDMNNDQIHSEVLYSNIRNNKIPSNQDQLQQQQQPQMIQYLSHQLTPIQPPSSFNLDNEIDAFHGSHKCHRDSMDVSNSANNFNWIFPLDCLIFIPLHVPSDLKRFSHFTYFSVSVSPSISQQ